MSITEAYAKVSGREYITKTQWQLGWEPSADPINGSPEGLIRMDNLQQDETGILSLVRGSKRLNVNNFTDYVSTLYSKAIGGAEVIWAGLNDLGRTVLRSRSGDFTDQVVVSNGNDKAVFGDCLGQVVIFNGINRKKDDGTNVKDLGLQTPGIPTTSAISQPTLAFYAASGAGTSPFVTSRAIGLWVLQEGHG